MSNLPEAQPDPSSEFDLKRDLLGPNLELKDQLSVATLEQMANQDLVRVTFLPFSSLGPRGIVATGEIYEETYRSFGLKRINRIAQLGMICMSDLIKPADLPDGLIYGGLYPRWQHCLTTAVVTELILRNNRFSEEEIKQGIIAGLLHDAAIMPFSDTLAGVNRDMLSEEINIEKYLGKFAHDEFDQRYQPDWRTIVAAIRKEGVLGETISLADKIAYTAYDCAVYTHIAFQAKERGETEGDYFWELVPILEKHPTLFDIFQDVRFDQESGRAYVEDADHLFAMLKVRALMYREVYANPQRLKRQAVTRAIAKPLFDEGKITLDDLLAWDDLCFLAHVIYSGPWGGVYRDASSLVGAVRYKTDEESRQAFDQMATDSGEVFWSEELPDFDLGLDFLVLHRGQILRFGDAFPNMARELEEIKWQASGKTFYYLKKEPSRV